LALAQRPQAARVLLVSGGFSGTARELLKHPVARIDYVELDPLLIELGRKYLPENLADSRIRLLNVDGRAYLKETKEKYDVVLLDVPAPSTAQLNRYYTAECFREVKRALVTNGVVCFPLGQYENYVSPELARLLSSARRSLKECFQNVLLLPGSRVFFLGSDAPLHLDIGERLEQAGIRTRLVNRHYLDAMLAPDRLADIERASTQPAALNTDFHPVLYVYHLRHWASQFAPGVGWLKLVIGLVLGAGALRLLVGRPRLRRMRLNPGDHPENRGNGLRLLAVLFVGGFTGASLEIVLLFAFQVMCGSVYLQVGIIVTAFMAGLALGAWMTARYAAEAEPKHPAWLAASALLLAGYSVALPVVLLFVSRCGPGVSSLLLVKLMMALVTFLLGVLVGTQFPLASQLSFRGSALTISRLYMADFVGASLGALLASSFLLPLLGVVGVCLLAALFNVGAAAGAGMTPQPKRT
jgi:spermidine synthase